MPRSFVVAGNRNVLIAGLASTIAGIAYGLAFASPFPLPGKVLYLIAASTALFFAWRIIENPRREVPPTTLVLSVWLLAIIGSVTLARGYSTDWRGTVQLFALEAPQYFFPLFGLVGFHYVLLNQYLRISMRVMAVGALAVTIISVASGGMQGWNRWLGESVFYLLGFYVILLPYLKLRFQCHTFVAIAAYVVNFGLATLRSYLGLLVFFVCCSLFHLVFVSKQPTSRRLVFSVNSFLIILACIIVVISVQSDVVYHAIGRITNNVHNKLLVDSRTDVVHYMLDGFTTKDWIVGRGAYGTYRTDNKTLGFNRGTIEIGYLSLLLKGGLVLLVPYVLVACGACFRGLRGLNVVSYAFGCVVVGRLLEMMVFGLPTVSATYLVFWLAVGACYNRELTSMTDSQALRTLLSDT